MSQLSLDEWLGGKRRKIVTKKITSPLPIPKTERNPFWEELKNALSLKENYKEVKIPKKKGDYRTIFVPSPELRRIQRKILRYLQKIVIFRRANIHGLSPGGSYVEHAMLHKGSRWIFKFDLKDAFPSANIADIRTALSHKILGTVRLRENTIENAKMIANARADLIIKLTTLRGKLPQGAPTSPFLFYILLTYTIIRESERWGTHISLNGLFHRLLAIRPRGFLMSCYVDGFVISGNRLITSKIQEKILKAVQVTGFEINPEKTTLLDCRQGAVLICGLIVDGKRKASLSKKTVRKWRGIIYRIAREIEDTSEINKDLLKEIQRVQGFIASLKPIYGEEFPLQIAKPCYRYKSALAKIT